MLVSIRRILSNLANTRKKYFMGVKYSDPQLALNRRLKNKQKKKNGMNSVCACFIGTVIPVGQNAIQNASLYS